MKPFSSRSTLSLVVASAVCFLAPLQQVWCAPAASASAPVAINPNTYKLGPQDVLSVVVPNYPAYSSANVPVLPDGMINLPFYGAVKAGGRTILEVQAELRKKLGQRMRNPNVLTLSIVTPRPLPPPKVRTVFVLGAVEKPGAVTIENGLRLAQVLAAAGGIKGRADEASATLTRPGKAPQPLEVALALEKPSSPTNILVQDGDVITVSVTQPGTVVVSGDVARQGVFELRRTPRFGNELSLTPRLLDVIIAAGGVQVPQNTGATDTEIVPVEGVELSRFTGTITRQGQSIALSVGEALTAKDANDNPANVPILPGDFVSVKYVPPKPVTMLTVFVEGTAARQPGTYTVAEGTRTLDVMARAGGLSGDLNRIRVLLRRAGSSAPLELNIQQAFLRDDPQNNPPVKNGDIVMVRQPDTLTVRATGRFTKPDMLQLPLNATLADAIAAAGGLAIPAREARLSVVRRLETGNQRWLRIDAVALLDEHDPTQNPRLQEGDWVDVSEVPAVKKPVVIVSGEVARVGSYEIEEGETLTQLIARAGGVTGEALRSDIVVQRGDKQQSVDAYDALVNGAPLDFVMHDDDFVTVKKNPNRVRVLEGVAKPGEVIMPEKGAFTLLDALNQAGGMVANANKKEVVLLRRVEKGAAPLPGAVKAEGLPENVQALVIALDKNIGAAAGVPLQASDVIYVPTKAAKSGSILSTLLPLTTLFRLF
jgi:polysaccharide biosynthesis/export protein